ncbi:exported protein [Synergistales bacterium]|nr:exported protein [Synergistales bacterium]
MKRKVLSLCVAFVAIFSCFLFVDAEYGYAATIPDGRVQLKIGTSGSATAAISQGAQYFADLMKERTDGLVTVKVFPSDSVSAGNQPKGIEMLMQGIADMTFHSNLIYSVVDDRFNVISLPWLFDDYADVDATLAGEAGRAINQILDEKGIKGLGFAQNGFRQITNNIREVKTLSDVKGLKIRCNNSKMQIALFKAMGADPLNMNFPEVFTALQQGAIDGQETPVDIIHSSKFQEVQRYISLWGYIYDAFILGINKARFESFSPQLQEIIVKAAEETCEYQRTLIRKLEARQIEDFRGVGMSIINKEAMDIDSFKQAAQVIYTQYEPIIGKDLIELFQK